MGFNLGTVFAINKDGTGCQVLHQFTGFRVDRDGDNPTASLVLSPDGYLYGTTVEGGAGSGTVFRLRIDGSDYRVIHAFGIPTGGNPYGKLLIGADGALYGTASIGRVSNGGVVFRVQEVALPLGGSSFQMTVLHEFQNSTIGLRPLYGPTAGLEDGGDGWFYGTCANGGSLETGGVYRIDAAGAYEEIYAPTSDTGVVSTIFSRLFRASDGGFYGYSNNNRISSGSGGYGAFFRTVFEAGGWRTSILFEPASRAGHVDLQRPSQDMRMVEGPDGRLYGTGPSGGDGSSYGGVFVTLRNGDDFKPAVLFRDRAPNPGQAPRGGLLRASDGWLYGTTSAGGAHGGGTLFRLRPGTLTFPVITDVATLTQGADFDASTPGAAPVEYQRVAQKDMLVRVQPYTLGPPDRITSASLHVLKSRFEGSGEVNVMIPAVSLPTGSIAGHAAGLFTGAPTVEFWVPASVLSLSGNYHFTLRLAMAGSPAVQRVPLHLGHIAVPGGGGVAPGLSPIHKYISPGVDLSVLLFLSSRDQARLKPDNVLPWTPGHRNMILETLLEVGRLLPVKRGVFPFSPGNTSAGLRFQLAPSVMEASPLETAALARRRFRAQMGGVLYRQNAALAARGIRDGFDLVLGLEATSTNREVVVTRSADGRRGVVSSEFGIHSQPTAPSLLLAGIAEALGASRSTGPLVLPEGRQMVNLLTRTVVPAPQQVVNAGAFIIPVGQAVLHGAAWNSVASQLRGSHRDLRGTASSARRANVPPTAVFHLGAILEASGTVSVEFSERLTAPGPTLTEPVAGSPWRLVFVGGNGLELSAVPFASEFDEEGFAVVFLDVELPAEATGVRLVRETTVLWEKTFSSQPPVITALSTSLLSAQQVRVTWAAQDADGDELTYTVAARIQGEETDRVLGVGLKGHELTFDTSLMPTGAITAKLEASDGFNVASAVSEAFQNSPSEPLVAITKSGETGLRLSSQPVALTGVAYDATAGTLPGASLRWFEGDTLLGTGEQLVVNLATGNHTVRLEATGLLNRY